MEQKITIDSGTYEAASLDDFAVGDVGFIVKSPYKDTYADPPNPDKDTYAGEPFVMGVDQLIIFKGTYCKVDDNLRKHWIVRHLRPGESVTITGGK